MINPNVGNPNIGDPSIGNPNVGNPNVGNPNVGNPNVGSLGRLLKAEELAVFHKIMSNGVETDVIND